MFWILLGGTGLLLLFPETVSAAAADGAMLWWTRVFPTLVPYLILTGLVLRAGPGSLRLGRLHPYAALSFLLGAIGGYPIGARVLAEGERSGAVTTDEVQRFSVASGLMSPAFLVSFTAIGLFREPAAIPVLCGAVYGTMLGALWLFGRAKSAAPLPAKRKLTANDLSDAIADAMATILRIGGCIVACRVLGAVLDRFGVARLLERLLPGSEPIVRAVLSGLLEMTDGTVQAAALPLPLGIRLALCVFFQVFGGASVLLQVRSFLRSIRFGRYVLLRLLLAAIAALLCYALSFLLPQRVVTASALTDAALARGQSLLGLLLPCGMGLLAVVYGGLLLRPLRSAEHRAQHRVRGGRQRHFRVDGFDRQHDDGRGFEAAQRRAKAEQLP